jgi:hypothetical protein
MNTFGKKEAVFAFFKESQCFTDRGKENSGKLGLSVLMSESHHLDRYSSFEIIPTVFFHLQIFTSSRKSLLVQIFTI